MRSAFAVLWIILSVVMLSGCGDKIKPGEHQAERPAIKGVEMMEIIPTEVTDYYETAGTVKARNTALVSAKISGEVRSIRVRSGDRVQKGDILLIISIPDIQARSDAVAEALEASKRGLEVAAQNKLLAEKTFERYKRLYEEKAISGQEFDDMTAKKNIAVTEYERAQRMARQAEAELTAARAFSDYSVIRSPLNGLVAEKMIDIGSMTVPGEPLFVIEEPVYRVEVPVDEKMLSYVNENSPIIISIDAVDMTSTTRVSEIVRQIDPLTRTFTVKVDINNDSRVLRGGFYAKVRIPLGKGTKLLVPERSVVKRGQLEGVYVVDKDGIVTMRLVRTGKKIDEMIEVLSGLSEGEKVIVKGLENAVDGGRIDQNG